MPTLSCFHAIKRTDATRPPTVAAYVNAVFLGDRSGSMSTMGSAPQDGAAEFLNQHKLLSDKNPDSEIIVTLVTFDDRAEYVYSGPAKNITAGTIARARHAMFPRNTTRLIDTAIEEIHKQQKMINNAEKKYHDTSKTTKTISREAKKLVPTTASSFTLLTDGDDNRSESVPKDLNDAISTHSEMGTVCLFAAANQDAVRVGSLYGFHGDCSLQIGTDVDEARAAFKSCTAAAMRSATQQSSEYTPVERQESCAWVGHDNDVQQNPFGVMGSSYVNRC